jgi:RNA recognition motif-containing protein
MRQDKFRGNIFVANLPKGFTDQQLADAFDAFGIVVGAFLARDPATGAPKRHGLVALAPDRAVALAVSSMNGKEIGGQRIDVRVADPTMALAMRTRPAPAPAPMPRNDYPPPVETRRTFQVEYRPLGRR